MNTDQLFASIALLIELAQKGEIDPWDVQVIEVIDRYLSKLLANQEILPSAYETDLSQSGQAFLSASMLVLFKANTLSALALNPIEENDELLADFAEATLGQSRAHYDRHIHRRTAALPPQKRAVTLPELIAQLQLMAAQKSLNEQENHASPRRRHLRLASRAQITRATLELAHQENLTEVAAKLDQFLIDYSQQLPEQSWLNLDRLVELWHQETSYLALPDNDCHLETTLVGDRVSVFSALLLLSAQSKVELEQAEFYQEINIRTLTVSAVSGGAEGVEPANF
jgi:segregation and condensation protein A